MSRQYVAIPTLVTAMYRMVETDELQLCSPLFSTDGNVLRDEILSKSRLPDPAVRLLVEMDRKLDAVLGLMRRDELRKNFPHDARITLLGADVLRLECREPLAPGDHLELVMLLEEYPMNTASCIVGVEKRLPEAPVTGRNNGVFAMSYSRLREADKESIIRYVFQEERRRIRQIKSEESEDGFA